MSRDHLMSNMPETVTRGRFFGVCMFREEYGRVLEHDTNIYRYIVDQSAPFVAQYVTDSDGLLLSDIDTKLVYHQIAYVSNRCYGVWVEESQNMNEELMSELVGVLIDMDPEQARMCEFRARRN